MAWLRHPTVQFFGVFIAAPLAAMAGVALDSPALPMSTSLAGWWVTLMLWVVFGVRSLHYEWRTLPREPGSQRPNWKTLTFLELKALLAVALVTVLAAMLALALLGLLTMQALRWA